MAARRTAHSPGCCKHEEAERHEFHTDSYRLRVRAVDQSPVASDGKSERFSKLEHHIDELHRRLDAETAERKRAQENYRQVSAKVKSLKSAAQKAEARYEAVAAQKRQLELTQAERAGNVELFETERKDNESLRRKIDLLEQSLEHSREKDKSSDLQSLQREVKRLRTVESHNIELRTTIQTLSRDKELLKATVSKNEGDLAIFRQNIEEANKAVADLQALQDLAKRETDQLQIELTAKDSVISGLRTDVRRARSEKALSESHQTDRARLHEEKVASLTESLTVAHAETESVRNTSTELLSRLQSSEALRSQCERDLALDRKSVV
jgi:chromosome segregation ATPase